MTKSKHRKGQSTLEYLLIITAIVGVILFAAANWLKPAVQHNVSDADNALADAADMVRDRFPIP